MPVESISEIFDNLYVITIERNHLRRVKVIEQLKEVNYSFYYGLDLTKEFLDCKYVSDLPDDLFSKFDLDKEYCSRWSKGQMGCFATEKKLMLDFIENGNGCFAYILDDVIMDNDWEDKLIKCYNQLPQDWDALVLGTRMGKEKKRFMRPIVNLKRRIETLLLKTKRNSIVAYSENLDKCNRPLSGVFGIIYSQKGLNKLFNEPQLLRQDQDDVLLSRLIKSNYFETYITYPNILSEGVYDGSWTQRNDFKNK